MKTLLTLLVLLVASSGSKAAGESSVMDAWRDTCRLTVYVCDGISPPWVVSMPLRDNLYGLHIGGLPFVFINSGIREPIAMYSTVAHEMTHYLQFWTGAKLTRCEQEAEAFAVKNAVLVENGRADLRNDRWRTYYGC